MTEVFFDACPRIRIVFGRWWEVEAIFNRGEDE
jgi:hypothetical protein